MGIYIFNTSFLVKKLLMDAKNEHSSHDFGKDIIPSLITGNRIFAFPFFDVENNQSYYWRDVGTLDSYWEASMELIGVSPELNLYDREWPIHTSPQNYPAAKFVFNENGRQGKALDSIVSDGCIISGAEVQHSLLSTNVRIKEYSFIKNSVILPNVRIGANCRIINAIIDKETNIPAGTTIGENPEEDRRRFEVSSGGIVLVEPEMLGQNLHQIE